MTSPSARDGEAVRRLATAVVESSFRCAVALERDIGRAFSTDEHKQHLAQWACMAECAAFFLHHVNRLAFENQSPVERTELLRVLGPVVISDIVASLTGDWSEERRTAARSELFRLVNARETDCYGECTAVLLEPTDDHVFDSIRVTLPKSTVN